MDNSRIAITVARQLTDRRRHESALHGITGTGPGLRQPADGGPVHKWVDDDGVTHYSDEAPPSVVTTLIELPEPPRADSAGSSGEPQDDYYSISNQWQRMHQERLERERLNLERERIRVARQAPPAAAKDDDDAVRYLPVYSGFGYYRPHRRHHRYHGRRRNPVSAPFPRNKSIRPVAVPRQLMASSALLTLTIPARRVTLRR